MCTSHSVFLKMVVIVSLDVCEVGYDSSGAQHQMVIVLGRAFLWVKGWNKARF